MLVALESYERHAAKGQDQQFKATFATFRNLWPFQWFDVSSKRQTADSSTPFQDPDLYSFFQSWNVSLDQNDLQDVTLIVRIYRFWSSVLAWNGQAPFAGCTHLHTPCTPRASNWPNAKGARIFASFAVHSERRRRVYMERAARLEETRCYVCSTSK